MKTGCAKENTKVVVVVADIGDIVGANVLPSSFPTGRAIEGYEMAGFVMGGKTILAITSGFVPQSPGTVSTRPASMAANVLVYPTRTVHGVAVKEQLVVTLLLVHDRAPVLLLIVSPQQTVGVEEKVVDETSATKPNL